MGKKTWILKLTDEQYDCIARGMEYYHRMMCGQVDVVDEVCKHRIDDALKMSLKNSMFPELLPSQSCGWNGRVWLNPPYSRPLIEQFVHKMAEHNNGIALLFNRCDSKMFRDVIFEKASSMLFMRKRIRFYHPDGTRGNSPGCGSILIAFGLENSEILKNSNVEGKFVWLNK